jgi:hypothetical protein
MKVCDNSTLKIHISNNLIFSISLLTMFDTALAFGFYFCQANVHPVYEPPRRYDEDVG